MMIETILQIDTQLEAAWLLRDSQPVEARSEVDGLLSYLRSVADTQSEAHALVIISYLECRLQHYDLAFLSAFAALETLQQYPSDAWLPRLHNVLSIVYGELGERTLEREHLHQQIDLSRQIGDLEWEATGYHDLAIHMVDRDLDAALAAMEQALTMFQEANLIDGIAYALSNLGDFRGRQQQWQLAYDHSYEALLLARSINLRYIQISTAGRLAKIAAMLGRHTEAEQYLAEAFEVSRTEEPDWSHEIWQFTGDYALAINDYSRATQAYHQALHMYTAIGALPGVYQCHAKLSACYEAMGDTTQALVHYKQFFRVKEQVLNREVELKLRSLEMIHRTRTAQREAELERKKNYELQCYIAELESLQKQLREQSLRDALTNLHNRRALIEQGELQVQIALRYKSVLSIAMLDIDHFKLINDNYTHAIGDQVLRQLAQIATSIMRQIDVVARYGGEEFVILLPETDLAHAAVACERLRQAIELFDWDSIRPGLQVTISIGLASMTTEENLESILYRADTQLYEAKRRGRNQLCA